MTSDVVVGLWQGEKSSRVVAELRNSPNTLKVQQSLVHFCRAQSSCPQMFFAAVKQLAALKPMNELKSFL